MINRILGILLVVSMFSCTSSYSCVEEDVETCFLKEGELPQIKEVSFEVMEVPNNLSNYYVVSDSILLEVNDRNPSPYIVTLYNMKTGEKIVEYFKRGSNGIDELISAMVSVHDNEVVIYDYTQSAITRLQIDSIVKNKEGYIPLITYKKESGMGFVYKNDSTILFNNANYFNGFGNEKASKFIEIDVKNGFPIQDIENDVKYDAFSINYRVICHDKERSSFLVFHQKHPIVEVYDNNLKLIKQYVGPEDCDFDYYLTEDDEIRERNVSSFFYGKPTSSSNYIIVVNNRYYKQPKRMDLAEAELRTQEFWKFNYAGQVMERYKILNAQKEIHNISYSEKENVLYFNSFDENDESIFCKVNLN